MQAMIQPRWGHCAAVFEGQILVIGGQDDTAFDIKDITVYDPKTDEWKICRRFVHPL